MLIKFSMLPREAPLCLEHFLTFSRNHLEDLQTHKTGPIIPIAPAKEAASPSPARVQPRRAAKNKNPVYIKPATKKRKGREEDYEDESTSAEESDMSTSDESSSTDDSESDDDKPIRKGVRLDSADLSYKDPDRPTPEKRKTLPAASIPPSKRRKIEIDVRKLRSRINKISSIIETSESDCVFGFKPWICSACEEEKFMLIRKVGMKKLLRSSSGTVGIAEMEPGKCEAVLRWEVDVPREQRFNWEGMEFAVDACDGVMLLML